MRNPKNKKAKAHIHETEMQKLRARALDLRLEGKTQRQIAAEMGCALSTVNDYLVTAIADIPRELAEEVRLVEGEKLSAQEQRCHEVNERMLKIIRNPKAEDASVVAAAGRFFDGQRTLDKKGERRAKLFGLNAPEVHELGGIGGAPLSVNNIQSTPADARRIMAELFGNVTPQSGVPGAPESGSHTAPVLEKAGEDGSEVPR